MGSNHRMDGDSTAANNFGGALKRHRQRLAWSQEDLADASGVAARTISDLERGVAQQPRSSTVRMLAEALSLSGADLAAFKAAARGSREAGLAGGQAAAEPAAVVRRECAGQRFALAGEARNGRSAGGVGATSRRRCSRC
jgi:transcriptional regulator with XRE-family HTH domain